MALNYDFYESPLPKDSKRKPKLHARVVPSGTIDTENVADLIHEISSLTTADVKGVLTALTQVMVNYLSYGYRIHLEGLGYFQLTLSCPPVYTPREIRAESIHVKSLVYRPDAIMRKEIKKIRCSRVKEKNHSHGYSEVEIDSILTGHFTDNPYITKQELARICSLTQSTAYRRLKQLIADGKLKPSTLHRSLYEPVKGHYCR